MVETPKIGDYLFFSDEGDMYLRPNRKGVWRVFDTDKEMFFLRRGEGCIWRVVGGYLHQNHTRPATDAEILAARLKGEL